MDKHPQTAAKASRPKIFALLKYLLLWLFLPNLACEKISKATDPKPNKESE